MLLARPFLLCSSCGSFMRHNSGRGELLAPCDPRRLKNDKQRQARVRKLAEGKNPLDAEIPVERARPLTVEDAEAGYLRLIPHPA